MVSQLGISELEMGGGLHPGLVDNWRVHRLDLLFQPDFLPPITALIRWVISKKLTYHKKE